MSRIADHIRNVAWVGNLFFQPHMNEVGFDCRRIPLPHPKTFTWEDICAETGFTPDVVVYADTSRCPPLIGLESWPSFNVFYCIDSHLHSWYRFYAQAFDMVCGSLRDHLWRFEARLTRDDLVWLPPAAQDVHQPNWEAEKEWDLLFAGNVSQATTPKRYDFLHELGERVPGLVIRQGRFQDLFPKARLSLNIAEKGDLNFRVFEGLACGACLLSPLVKHGFLDLFEDGKHLFAYSPGRMDELVRLIEGLLEHPERVARVARAGHALVDAKHRFINRAELLRDQIASRSVQEITARRRGMAGQLRDLFLKQSFLHFAEQYRDLDLGARYLLAATGKL